MFHLVGYSERVNLISPESSYLSHSLSIEAKQSSSSVVTFQFCELQFSKFLFLLQNHTRLQCYTRLFKKKKKNAFSI